MNLWQLALALSILVTAGICDLVGQCAVLFLNRVPFRRFLWSLLRGLLVFVAAATLWALGLWMLAWLLSVPISLARCFWWVALAHTPLFLGWLVLLPHFGSYLFHALRALVFLNLVVAVGVESQAPLLPVILCCLPGWLLHFSLTHLKLLPLQGLQNQLWRVLGVGR